MLDLARLNITFLAGTLGQGGAERQLYYMMQALTQAGTRVRLLTLTRQEYWEDKIKALGVPVIWVGESQSKLRRLRRIIAELRKQPADIVQSQHFFTNLYAVAAARTLKFREIGAMRSNAINEVQANGKILGRLSLHTPRTIAANSRAAIRNAVKMGIAAHRLHLLPNVINCADFSTHAKPESDTITVITVGRLVAQKRHDRFLSVLARLRRQTTVKVKGWIIGDGPLRQQLEQQAADLELGPDILEFTGKRADMSVIYRQADILMLTSDYEGTPNVVLEAMTSGLPVIATRVGGVPDLIQHQETGYLVDSGDEEGMLQALRQLISCPSVRKKISYRAHQYVTANHALEKLPGFLTSLYETALL